jgi:alpha-2-macroglobulin
MFWKKLTSTVLLFLMYLGMFAPIANAQTTPRSKIPPKRRSVPKPIMNMTGENGLNFRLSEGSPEAESRNVTKPADTQNLSESESANLLKRLPPVKVEGDDQQDFAKRAGTLPPPKTGKVVPVKFPSDEERGTPKVNNNAALEVVRYSPQGDVPLVPDLSITFSQPMVAVTSQEQAAQTVPVRLTPEVKGKWRWLGTKTLIFDAEQRFPMATKFTAVVQAGTKSAIGNSLNKDVSWTFTTPPPKLIQSYPNNQVTKRDALMFAAFDQEINPQAVIQALNVTGAGKKVAVRLATQEEINVDGSISYYSKQSQPNRWLAFRAVEELPAASPINVTFPVGTPSGEGPLTTKAAQSFGFQTFGAMRFVKSFCAWENNPKCSPFENFVLQFTNPLDAAAFDKASVKIEPAVEGLTIYPNGNYLYIQGYKPGRKTYKVTVDAGAIKDSFGQTLSNPVSATFAVGAAEPSLRTQGGNFVVLDPTAKPNYSVYSVNQPTLKVQIRAVSPQDWEAFRQYMRYMNYDEQKQPPLPGRVVFNQTVKVENKPDEMVETRLDLSPALNDGFGHAIVLVEPTVRRDQYDRTKIVAWAQATQIGLDAFVDNQELVGFATELQTGKALSGVELAIYPNNGTPLSQQKTENSEQTASSFWDWFNFWGTSETNIQEEKPETTTAAEPPIAKTDDSGLLRLALPEGSQKTPNLLIARRGKDVAFMPEQSDYYWQDYGSWYKKSESESLRWFIFDDRQMYRPKEEVAIKGYLRKMTAGKFADITELGDAARGISYTVYDSRGNEITKGTANLNAFGAFDFKFKLTDTMNLGYGRVDISTSSSITNSSTSHTFQVQEFRRPEFEVTAKNETEAPYFVGGSANVSVEAKYYAGGALPNAQTNWYVTATPTNYTPPNRDDFTFGKWFPWWRSYDNYGATTSQSFQGVTGADGKHLLKVDFVSANPARPHNLNAQASVSDVNRQTWTASTNLLVHPADLYIGIRTARTFVNKGEKFTVESIVSDIDGKLVANRAAKITAVLKDWQFDKGEWKQVAVDEQTCEFTSVDGIAKCAFTAKQGGVYTITATVMDDRERTNESELTLWVSGGKTPPKRTVEKEEAQLIPDKKEYAPTDTAEILVQSPFVPAEGVLTLRRNGLVKTERFTMNEPSKVLKVTLEERYLPNINVQVDLTGAAERVDDKGETAKDAPKRPAFASGSLNLPISLASRKLNVTAEPVAKNLEPGGETTVNVEVKDSNNRAVANSEIAVVIVDESVLALSGYRVADPVSIFYQQFGAAVTDYHLRKDILLGNEKDLKHSVVFNGIDGTNSAVSGRLMEMSAGAADMAKPAPASPMMARAKKSIAQSDAREEEKSAGEPQTAINLRSNFNALAVFAPSVKTDASGKAAVQVKLPDNLTRYRITAVSVTNGKQFGKGESNITARQPLMVRPSAPRFMNFGDKIELPVVVQNQTDNPMTVDVAVRATNAELTAGNGRKVVIPANDRAEIRFPVSAMKAGTARFQIGVTAGKFTDAAEIQLPVWTPATTEAFATYGTTDQNEAIVQTVQTPGDVFPQFGGLEVTTSSTQLQELTDAYIYLATYRYACSEQISSRMIATAALRDVLQAFKAEEIPKPEELKAQFARDIETLKGRQRDDGSFGLWGLQRQRYEYPYVSINVAHALARAKAKGYDVPKQMLERSNNYLKNIERFIPKEYSQESRWAIIAYALYVRNLLGEKDAGKARNLIQTAGGIEKVSLETLGWLLNVFNGDKSSAADVAAILKHFNNRSTETAGAAHFVTSYSDGAEVLLHSDRRADGIILEAILGVQPNNDLIPKIVRGLLANKTKGRWRNTQENVFILLGLDRYFNVYEKVTPNFVAQVWLGSAYAGEQQFAGREVDFKQIDVPMNYLVQQNGAANLILNKQGAGRLYYRIGMKYAPKNLKLAPADYGFEVTRKYEAIDEPEDVKQNADGSWTIKAGARVRVRLSMVAPTRRYHVALVDPLPAGLEILNPELAVTGSLPADTVDTSVTTYGASSYGRGWYYWRSQWFDHQNFRDERAEAFTSLLWEGVWNYSYVTRATTPGEFVVPPAKAEEMYMPETFGRSGTDFVRVE